MQEGIEPTVSTIPLGCTIKIVSGDRPSTVSGNHSQHTISFSSECDWIPCGVIATVSNHSLPYSSVIRCDRWSTLATHLPSLCLSGLFPLSDLWYSSSSLSHRPSTFLLYVLQLSLSRTYTALVLCRWLAGVYQRITTPLFYSVNFLNPYVFYPLSLLQDHYTTTMRECQVFM